MSGRLLIVAGFTLALLDFAIPFGLLKTRSSFFGAFVYWSLLTIIVIAIGSFYLSTWGSSQQ